MAKHQKKQAMKEEGSGSKRGSASSRDSHTKRHNRVHENASKTNTKMNLKGKNDVSWYAYSQAILDSTANLYFTTPLGVPVPTTDVTLPGIMVLNWSPTYGVSSGDPNTPLNVAKNSLFAFVRHENSGHTNYEAGDLFMYMLAMDSLYNMYYEAQRVYGVTKLYSHSNRYYPKKLIEAMGWDADDVITNAAKLQATLNNAAFALGSFAVPADLALYQRHRFLTTNVFVDDEGAKAQTYLFKMAGYWRWEGFKSENGTKLEYKPLKADRLTIDGWAQGFMDLINSYLADEDIGIMTGDLMKAFGKDGLLAPMTTPIDYITLPTFDGEIASQIQNVVTVGRFAVRTPDQTVIDQYLGNVRAKYTVVSPATLVIPQNGVDEVYSASMWGGVLNIPADVPTPADVMVSTQLAAIPRFANHTGNTKPESQLYTCSSEVVHDITIYTGANGEATQGNLWPVQTMGNCLVLLDSQTDTQQVYFLNNLAKFKWHPYVYGQNIIAMEVGNPEDPDIIYQPDLSLSGMCLGDAQNVTGYIDSWLENRNRVALYTMLNSSYMGMFNPAK